MKDTRIKTVSELFYLDYNPGVDFFVSQYPWSAERPEALVVCCSDGRYHQQIEDFIRKQVGEKPDLLAIPGGPAIIDPMSASFDHARVFEESMRLLVSKHALNSVWLIAHQGCSFYTSKYGDMNDEDLRRWQIRDLKAARDRILERWSHLDVRLIYAVPKEGRILFAELKNLKED